MEIDIFDGDIATTAIGRKIRKETTIENLI